MVLAIVFLVIFYAFMSLLTYGTLKSGFTIKPKNSVTMFLFCLFWWITGICVIIEALIYVVKNDKCSKE